MNGKVNWITTPGNCNKTAYTFQKEVSFSGKVKKATLYVTAIGVYSAKINGKSVTDAVLMPGWTDYNKRVQFQEYDVTSLVSTQNLIQVGVGAGWAVGHIGYGNQKNVYDNKMSLALWLKAELENGDTEEYITDESWQVYTSHIVYTDIYNGETQDMTAEDEYVGNAVPSDVKTKVIPQVGEWIKEQDKFFPCKVIITPKGERVIDFGQNLTGYVKLLIKAPRGSVIKISHAEVLDKDGNFYTGNYRGAESCAKYICSGEEDEFKPCHTFYGFRFIRLDEYPFEEIDTENFCAIAVHSDIKRTGYFSCGNDKINQLYHNIIWGQKSNYLDIPTDCPQRDERLGWTGDAQVFCRTAAINFDVERFFKKWLGDVAGGQSEDGAIDAICPMCIRQTDNKISAAWADCACVIPWELYKAYGNCEILSDNFDMMKKWVDYVHGTGSEEFLWLGGNHFGDWLGMDAGEDSYIGATSQDFIASAFFYYSASLLVKAGEVLGKDMIYYKELCENIKSAFREYFMLGGEIRKEFKITQTAIVLILHFGLCEEEEKALLCEKLVKLIRENGNRMTTGFVGTPYILHALSECGHTDVAYELLFQEKSPSWLYSVNHGATTMWEHWNSIKEDGTFWSDDMNSFNHYAYGAVFDWIFGVSCGVKTCDNAPGYKEIDINPHPDKRMGFADASYHSKYGKIRVQWNCNDNGTEYKFEIPKGVTAHITLPSGLKKDVGDGVFLYSE